MGEVDIFQWLENSALAVNIRHSHILYPVIEIVHIFGFTVLVGSAFLFDLRLLGLSKGIPVTHLARHLLPLSRLSLLLVIPSGFILFMTQATSLSTNDVFWTKVSLILLAFLNAGFFHLFTFRDVDRWDIFQPTAAAAKVSGIISIILWVGILSCGRFLAYLE